jgi:hypothetical protein
MGVSFDSAARMLAGFVAIAVGLFGLVCVAAGLRPALLAFTVFYAACALGFALALWCEDRRFAARMERTRLARHEKARRPRASRPTRRTPVADGQRRDAPPWFTWFSAAPPPAQATAPPAQAALFPVRRRFSRMVRVGRCAAVRRKAP